MISNITNALPTLLKKIKTNDTQFGFEYDLAQSIRFYQTLVSKRNHLAGLKHMYIDIAYRAKPEFRESLLQLNATLDTFSFIRDFQFRVSHELGTLSVRGSYQDFAVFSLIILGAIEKFGNQFNNRGFLTVMAQNFISYCIANGYNVCTEDKLKTLQAYNSGIQEFMFDAVSITPTPQSERATFNFIGIPLDKDVLCILEKYSGVDFTYNQQNGSFLVTMDSGDWDDFWKNAPDALKSQFQK